MNIRGLFVIALIMALFSACAQRDCPERHFSVISVDGGISAHILEYLGRNQDVRIPPRIGDLPVTSIGAHAFQQRNLTSVSIPHSVRYIGTLAFAFNQLTSITLPSSLVFIGEEAFRDNQLRGLSIPPGVTSIGDGAFVWNHELSSVTIPAATILHAAWWEGPFDPGVMVTRR